MRRLLPVALIAGCGRVGFDARQDAQLDQKAPLVCPAGFSREANGGCYQSFVNMVELPWLDAELACEALGAGSHLIVIDDPMENSIAATALGVSSDGWVGASDRVTEDLYLTVTGQPWLPSSWGPAEPDGAAQDCLRIYRDGSFGDRLCADLNDYFCEYDGIDAMPSAF